MPKLARHRELWEYSYRPPLPDILPLTGAEISVFNRMRAEAERRRVKRLLRLAKLNLPGERPA